MSWAKILVGAAAVIALLLIAPLLGLIAVAVFLVAGLFMWLTDSGNSRPCPVCGEAVKNGVTECGSCGHDFRAAAGQEPKTTA